MTYKALPSKVPLNTAVTTLLVAALAAAISFWAQGEDIATSLAFPLALLAIGIPYKYLYCRKPAAWIEDGILYIKSWPLTISKIPLDSVEHIEYLTGKAIHTRTGKREAHAIKLKMKGYAVWELPIVDWTEHIRDHRLYNFLKSELPDTTCKAHNKDA